LVQRVWPRYILSWRTRPLRWGPGVSSHAPASIWRIIACIPYAYNNKKIYISIYVSHMCGKKRNTSRYFQIICVLCLFSSFFELPIGKKENKRNEKLMFVYFFSVFFSPFSGWSHSLWRGSGVPADAPSSSRWLTFCMFGSCCVCILICICMKNTH
jgi:hypothetical protein